MKIKTGLGTDSHRFCDGDSTRKLVLGGFVISEGPPLAGNSDADVILHALTDAVSSITGRVVIGAVADEMCRRGVTDSREYLAVALADLDGWTLSHVAICLECQRPKIDPVAASIRDSVAGLLGIERADVGLTATSGEGLTDAGRGLGIHASVVITAVRED